MFPVNQISAVTPFSTGIYGRVAVDNDLCVGVRKGGAAGVTIVLLPVIPE